MLVFHAHCQMGNQMFIYAAARGIGAYRKLPYCLSEMEALSCFELYPAEQLMHKRRYRQFRLMNRIPGFKFRFLHLQDNREDYSEFMRNEKHRRVWYYGYFQGLRYFSNIEADIREAFRIREPYRQSYALVKQRLDPNKKFFTVHIRLRDYRTFGPDFLDGPDLTLPFAYYKKVIAERFDPATHQLIFLSDEIATVKEAFSEFAGKAFFSDAGPIEDFQLLMDAKVLVISHSSFAWWAAWLNPGKDKQILVPRYFLGFKVKKEFPVNMIPPGWETIEVDNGNFTHR